jgi:uncharacterized membrane protein YphA (DoxX/SURF4 family)
MNSYKMQRFGLMILRFGLAAVFLWFGFNQVLSPAKWIAFVPDWSFLSVLSAQKIVLINGVFEIIAGVLLILNIFTRIVSLLLAIHMAAIVYSLGLKEDGVNSFGIGISALSLFFLNAGRE